MYYVLYYLYNFYEDKGGRLHYIPVDTYSIVPYEVVLLTPYMHDMYVVIVHTP